jgi:hypothetical protein
MSLYASLTLQLICQTIVAPSLLFLAAFHKKEGKVTDTGHGANFPSQVKQSMTNHFHSNKCKHDTTKFDVVSSAKISKFLCNLNKLFTHEI